MYTVYIYTSALVVRAPSCPGRLPAPAGDGGRGKGMRA